LPPPAAQPLPARLARRSRNAIVCKRRARRLRDDVAAVIAAVERRFEERHQEERLRMQLHEQKSIPRAKTIVRERQATEPPDEYAQRVGEHRRKALSDGPPTKQRHPPALQARVRGRHAALLR
jgi:hypothetical protein